MRIARRCLVTRRVGEIEGSQRQHGAGGRQQGARIGRDAGALGGEPVQPAHQPGADALMQAALGLGERLGAGDAHNVEAERMRPLADMLGERAAGRVCDWRRHVAEVKGIQKSPRLVTKNTISAYRRVAMSPLSEYTLRSAKRVFTRCQLRHSAWNGSAGLRWRDAR